jgi:hypothetical protein
VNQQIQARMNAVLRELTTRYGRNGYLSSGKAYMSGLVPKTDDETTYAAAQQLAQIGAVVTSARALALSPAMRLMLICPALVAGWSQDIDDIQNAQEQREALDSARTELQALVAWSCASGVQDADLTEATAMAAAVLVVEGFSYEAASLSRSVQLSPYEKLHRLLPAMKQRPADLELLRAVFRGAHVDESWLTLQMLKKQYISKQVINERQVETQRSAWHGVATNVPHQRGEFCNRPCCRGKSH